MNCIVPRERLRELVETVYPKGEVGRHPIELERMLRIYFLQQWNNLNDPGAEETLNDSASMQRFGGVDFGTRWALRSGVGRPTRC
jgi:IS5 family transposase